VHRVVRDVDDVVAPSRAVGQDRGDAGNGIGSSIDDTVEVDEQQQTHALDRSGARRSAPDEGS
jgi:hypothetical protein